VPFALDVLLDVGLQLSSTDLRRPPIHRGIPPPAQLQHVEADAALEAANLRLELHCVDVGTEGSE
jgi:hypothetical protein